MLSMKDLTLKDDLEMAQAMEAADKNINALQGSELVAELVAVNQISRSHSQDGLDAHLSLLQFRDLLALKGHL